MHTRERGSRSRPQGTCFPIHARYTGEVHTYLVSLVPPSPHRVQQYWKPNLGAIFNGLVHPAESANGPLPLRACTIIVKTPSAGATSSKSRDPIISHYSSERPLFLPAVCNVLSRPLCRSSCFIHEAPSEGEGAWAVGERRDPRNFPCGGIHYSRR